MKQREKDEDSFQVPKREARSADLGGTACAVLRVRKARERGGLRKRKQERKRRQSESNPNISGDNSLRDPPVPIPNTEVKPQHADSTWLETAR